MKEATEWFALFKNFAPHLALMLEWMLKTGILFLFASLVVFLLRHRSARARCWIWRLFFATLALLLFVEWSPQVINHFRPKIAVSIDAQTHQVFWQSAEKLQIFRTRSELQALEERYQAERLNAPPEVRPPWVRDAQDEFRPTLDDIRTPTLNQLENAIPWLWAIGSIGALLLLAIRSSLGLRWLRKHSTPADHAILEAAQHPCAQLSVRKAPELRISPHLDAPLLFGLFRPLIYLPVAAGEWGRMKLLDVLFHELAHWKRRDFIWLQVGRIMVAIYWWNPFVRSALRSMNETAEEASDDRVLLEQRPADAYAQTLVEIAAGINPSRQQTGLPMIGYRSLEKRIRHLMNDNRWRGKLGKFAAAAIAATLVVGLLISSVYIGRAAPAPSTKSSSRTMTERQKALAERIIASTKKRLETFRWTHVQLETHFVEETGQKRLTSPMPSKMEAWSDSWANRYRMEYTPQVIRWIGGASDFSISDQTSINDGRHSYYWKEGDTPAKRLSSPRDRLIPDYLNLYDSEHLIRILSMLIENPSLQYEGMEYAITETTWEGKDAVKIVESFHQDGKLQQQKTVIVATLENDLIRFSETVFSQNPNGNFRNTKVEEVQKTADGETYASKYTTVGRLAKTLTTTQYTLVSFETLPQLPAGILDLPKAETVSVNPAPAPVQPEAIALQCMEPEKGTPVPDVKLVVAINKEKAVILHADEHGKVKLPLPREEITYLEIETGKTGFVPRMIRWDKEGESLQIPTAYSIKLVKGSPISGRVVDEAGAGIPGASVRFHLTGGPRIWGAFVDCFRLTGKVATAKTDAQGQWSLPDFPAHLNGLGYQVTAPGYQPTGDRGIQDFRSSTGLPYTALRDGSVITTLQRGNELRGRITDEKGVPVQNCRVVIGTEIHGNNQPAVVTDTDGEYVLKGLRSGSTWVTVESSVHQPVAKKITLPLAAPLDFVLNPGRVIRGRVIKTDGTPSAGLNVNLDSWNQLRTLAFSTQTDGDGIFIWRGAPKEPVEFTFGSCQSREFLSELPLKASDKLQAIVMKPALQFKGKVVDDQTGKPIKIFTLIYDDATYPGEAVWRPEHSQVCRNGQFDWSDTRFGRRYVFRFEAPGYEPLVTDALEARQTLKTMTLRLKAAGQPQG